MRLCLIYKKVKTILPSLIFLFRFFADRKKVAHQDDLFCFGKFPFKFGEQHRLQYD